MACVLSPLICAVTEFVLSSFESHSNWLQQEPIMSVVRAENVMLVLCVWFVAAAETLVTLCV